MIAEKIKHKGETRIKVSFPINDQLTTKLRTIAGCRWSQTHKAWHLPYSKEVFASLKTLFPDLSYRKPALEKEQQHLAEVKTPTADVMIYVHVKHIAINLPKKEEDVNFLRNIRFARWDTKRHCWQVPNYGDNLEKIKDYFNGRIGLLEESGAGQLAGMQQVKKGEVLGIRTRSGRLRLIFGYEKRLITTVKSIPYHNWNAMNHWWSVPFSEAILRRIKEDCLSNNLRFFYEEEEKQAAGVRRISRSDIPNYRSCPARVFG
jgi:integrase/recombinase XerD